MGYNDPNPDVYLPLDVDFFTNVHPEETPEFCGCLIDVQATTKENIKQCYLKALKGGPAPYGSGRRTGKWRRAKRGKGKIPKGRKGKNKEQKKLLRKLKKKLGRTFPFRNKRSIDLDNTSDDYNDQYDNEIENETEIDEDFQHYDEEDYVSSGW